jgi:hypothetical protein
MHVSLGTKQRSSSHLRFLDVYREGLNMRVLHLLLLLEIPPCAAIHPSSNLCLDLVTVLTVILVYRNPTALTRRKTEFLPYLKLSSIQINSLVGTTPVATNYVVPQHCAGWCRGAFACAFGYVASLCQASASVFTFEVEPNKILTVFNSTSRLIFHPHGGRGP